MPSLIAVVWLCAPASAAALQLHLKAGPDGRSVGDCPFAHAVRLALAHKSLDVELIPHAPDAKPRWLLDEHGGAMPALVHEAGAVVDSRAIVGWIEASHPSTPSLTPPGLAGAEALAAAEAACDGLFGVFARYCKSAGGGGASAAEESELKKALLLRLCRLDAHLAAHSPHAAGADVSTADCFLLPQLYHVQVAGTSFTRLGGEPLLDVPEQFGSLRAYMERGFGSGAFASTAPPPAMVRWGWANARGDSEAAVEAAAEL